MTPSTANRTRLYFAPGACSLAVHIALREAGLDFELTKVDLAKHTLPDGSDFHAVNPRGYVPVLESASGQRRTEVAALLLGIAAQAPAGKLLPPAGSDAHQDALQWLVFVATELHKTFSPWLWHKETADSTRQAAKDKLAARFSDLDAHLSQREWLAGDFSVADIYGFTIVNWCHFLGISLKPYPSLSAWLERVRQRPAVQAALRAEGLLS